MHRVVVVGCGNIAPAWLDPATRRPDVEIVGLVDIVPENALALRERYGLRCEVFDSLRTALRATSVTLVFDLTVPQAHHDVITTAFEEGCDVFGEKPMAPELDEARLMVEAARRSGRTYSVMQNRRYLPYMMALRDLIRSGVVGRIGFMASDFFVGLHNGGYRHGMEQPLLRDMSVHTWDQSRFLTGRDPVTVHAQTFNPTGSWFAGDSAAVVTFTYDDGARYSYRGCYSAEGSPTAWESSWRFVGENGSIMWDGSAAPYAEVVIPAEETVFQLPTRRVEAKIGYDGPSQHAGCLAEMFEALEAGRPSATDCTDHIKSLAMLDAVLRSAREGRPVKVAS